MTEKKITKPKKKLMTVAIEKFTFGIESENYVSQWPTDHDCTHETRSRVFNNYNALLIYYRNQVKRHMDNSQFMLHSYPEEKYSSSISAHIHLKANIDEWDEYSWDFYDRLFDLVNLFQVFFKNSPNKSEKVLSYRHSSGTWCELSKMSKTRFSQKQREYRALTTNSGFNTLEFRYNDVPKSLNQLSLFYYLVYLAAEHPELNIPKLPKNLKIHKLEEMDAPLNSLFSYKNIKSIQLYKQTYKKILYDFCKEVDGQVKEKFYDFYNNKHITFGKLASDSLEYEVKEFKKWFKSSKGTKEWSDTLKKKFCKTIKVELIK